MLLIIGYGNTLRGDDGFGPAVADFLKEQLSPSPEVEIISEHQLLPELAERIAAADQVVFIDVSNETNPGEIQTRPVFYETQSAFDKNVILPHSISPQTLLTMSKSLYRKTPEASIYTIGALSLDLNESLSPEILPKVKVLAEMIIEKFLS